MMTASPMAALVQDEISYGIQGMRFASDEIVASNGVITIEMSHRSL
jgi:hypothetical protein